VTTPRIAPTEAVNGLGAEPFGQPRRHGSYLYGRFARICYGRPDSLVNGVPFAAVGVDIAGDIDPRTSDPWWSDALDGQSLGRGP
jgi:hypothetical protein